MRRTYLQECHSCESRNPVRHCEACPFKKEAKQSRGVRCQRITIPHLTQNWRYVIAIALLALTVCSPLLADTTWVAGEVYGTWTRRGNPYLVTDTLTIPHDSTLNILPGVQIYFQNQQIRRTPINVLGRLRAIGEEGDSIYFYSPVAGFGGISNQNTPGTEIRLEYSVVDFLLFLLNRTMVRP